MIYRVDDIDVDTTRGIILKAGREVPLKPKAFRVLVHLLKERDRLVTKEELMDLFWNDTAVTDDALTQCIARLRRALGDDPRNPVYLKTVPRMGYRFVGPVQEVRAAPEALPLPPPNAIAHLTHARRTFWLVGVILIAGSLAGAAFWTERRLQGPPPAVQAKRVVAILPFENRSGQAELDWLREGLPDMLATTFSRSKSLDVLSREQVYTRRKRAGGVRSDLDFARSVHAHAAVTGSFSKLGTGMRVDVRIYDTLGGSLLATDDITVDQPDRILTQVDFLAGRLASRLGPQTGNQDRRGLASLMTDNLEAYRYYSLGIEKAEATETTEAAALFEKALALDPGFAMAQARIGYAYAVAAPYLDKGRPYLEKAFRMSGKLTDRDRRHIVAWYAIANEDYQSAIRAFTELIAEYPNDPEAYYRLAALLRGESRHEEALQFLQRASAIDPESPQVYNRLSAVSSEMGRHDDAIAMAEHYIMLAPGEANAYDSLGLAYYMAGQYDKALEAYRSALTLNPAFAIVLLHRSLVYAAMGRVKDGVHEALLEAENSAAHMTGCRGIGQATFILWRAGKLAEARKLVPHSRPDCDSPVFAIVARSSASAPVLAWAPGRGARFGQRTGLFFLAEHDRLEGRTDERLSNLQQLVRAKPGWAEMEIFEDALGDAYFELGRLDEAIGEYERALRLFPGLARARYRLAQAYRRKGQTQFAKTQFRQFLELWKQADPDLPELAEAKRLVQ